MATQVAGTGTAVITGEVVHDSLPISQQQIGCAGVSVKIGVHSFYNSSAS